jgi:hypothetical protein
VITIAKISVKFKMILENSTPREITIPAKLPQGSPSKLLGITASLLLKAG